MAAVITALGEALIDLMPAGADGKLWHARPGGAPMNVAVAAARLGAPTSFVGHLSTDRFGAVLRAHLDEAGVDISQCMVTEAATTLAVVDPGGASSEPGFTFHSAETTAISFDAVGVELPQGIVHLCGSVSAVLEPAAAAFDALIAGAGERLVSIDPNPRPAIAGDATSFAAHLDRWIDHADLVKVSRADLGWIEPALDAETVARAWMERGVRAVVVTRGGDGAIAHTAAGTVEVPSVPVEVIDTVGAGDTFTGGLLCALHEAGVGDAATLDALDGDGWRQALEFAVGVAAIACSRVGADPPWRNELAG